MSHSKNTVEHAKWDMVYFHRPEGQKRFIKGFVWVEPFLEFAHSNESYKACQYGLKYEIKDWKDKGKKTGK